MGLGWYGDDGPHLARRPAVLGDGALGEQARPVNLLARAGYELGRGGVRRGKPCWLTVKVCAGRQIRTDQTVGSSPGRPGWLLATAAVPLLLCRCWLCQSVAEARRVGSLSTGSPAGPDSPLHWGRAGSMYSQATVSSACVAARAVLRWDGTPEKGGSRQRGRAGTFGGHLPRSNLGACRAAGRVPPVVDSPLRAARVRGGGARSDRASVLPGGVFHAAARHPSPGLSHGFPRRRRGSSSVFWNTVRFPLGQWLERGLAQGAPAGAVRGTCPTFGWPG